MYLFIGVLQGWVEGGGDGGTDKHLRPLPVRPADAAVGFRSARRCLCLSVTRCARCCVSLVTEC